MQGYPIINELSPMSPIPIFAGLALSAATAYLLSRRFGKPESAGRFTAIEGLRGYLALSVFMAHGVLWYFLLHFGVWEAPSEFVSELGQGSVSLFFMITAFLFISKLLDDSKKPVDWTRLYVSRVMRLTPLYGFMIIALLSIVAILSDFSLREPALKVVVEALRWGLFTIFGKPDINQVGTSLITSGVTWSLTYEWLFYLLLPTFAFLLSRRPPMPALLLGACTLVAIYFLNHFFKLSGMTCACFLGGVGAAFCVRSPRICDLARSKLAAVLAMSCVGVVYAFEATAYCWSAIVLLSIAFTVIACGNTLFGALSSATSRMLGDMAYSIYLLHGMILFVVFRFVVGFEAASLMTPIMHWLILLGCAPVVVLLSFMTYRLIELPGMRATAPIVIALARWRSGQHHVPVVGS